MRLELIRNEDQFLGLKVAWNHLLIQTGIRSAFLTWEWMYTWWEQYRSELNDPELAIVAGYENEDLVLLFPGYCEDLDSNSFTGRVRTLQFLGSRFESTDYMSMIYDPHADRANISYLLDYLRERLAEVDQWRFIAMLEDEQLFDDLASFAQVKQLLSTRHHHRVCPYISLTGSYETYVQNLSKNMRYNVRRRTRNLLEKMDAHFRLLDDENDVASSVEHLFALHEKRWQTREGTSTFRADVRMSFHQAVSKRFFEADILRIFRIDHGESSVAMLYCFEFAGELMYFQAGFDPEWEKKSVGLVLMGKCIEWSHEKGLTLFDFMRGAEDYKFNWTKQARNMDLTTIALSPKGKSALRLEDGFRRVKENIKRRVPEPAWEKARKILGRY